MLAAVGDYVETLQTLISHGADVYARDEVSHILNDVLVVAVAIDPCLSPMCHVQ